MTTPAGWYDDGSGRQRWWDGQEWTEHYAPETAAPTEATAAGDSQSGAAAEDAASSQTSEPAAAGSDDAVWSGTAASETPAAETPAAETPASEAPANEWPANEPSVNDAPVSEAPAADAPSYDAPASDATAATTPISDDFSYAPPAAPPAVPPYGAQGDTYGSGAPAYGAPGSYPAASGAYQPGAGQYPTTGYPAAEPAGPAKPSVLGLVGLGLAVVGTILAFIPIINGFSFVFLAAGFIVALISLFLKGKKWPGISGLILSVVGTIIAVIMVFVYLVAFAQSVSDEIDSLPSSPPSVPSAEPTPDDSTTPDDSVSGSRPTVEEVETGINAIIAMSGAEGYTPEQVTCLAQEFVNSDLDDATLRKIADSTGDFADAETAVAFTEKFSEALPICLVP